MKMNKNLNLNKTFMNKTLIVRARNNQLWVSVTFDL